MDNAKATTEDIQAAILSLSVEARASLLKWMLETDKVRWDQEIERDFTADGPGASLLDQVVKDHRAGRCQKWD